MLLCAVVCDISVSKGEMEETIYLKKRGNGTNYLLYIFYVSEEKY